MGLPGLQFTLWFGVFRTTFGIVCCVNACGLGWVRVCCCMNLCLCEFVDVDFRLTACLIKCCLLLILFLLFVGVVVGFGCVWLGFSVFILVFGCLLYVCLKFKGDI